MDLAVFGQGLLMGFAVAAPVGPIGLLCIQRTLQDGRIYGLATGLGAATADAMYGLIAAFGLTFIASFFLDQQNWIALLGGLYLCFLGMRIFRSAPASVTEQQHRGADAPVRFLQRGQRAIDEGRRLPGVGLRRGCRFQGLGRLRCQGVFGRV